MRKKLDLIVLISLLCLLVGALVYARFGDQWFAGSSASLPTKEFFSANQGLRFRYPTTFQSTAISAEADNVGTIFRATHAQSALLGVRRETGLGVLKLSGNSIIDTLQKNVDRQYPKRFPDYQKQSLDDLVVGSEKGVAIEFTYTGTDETTTVRERLVIIVVRDSDAYFFSFQAPDSEFQALQPRFKTLLDSVEFNQPTQEKSPLNGSEPNGASE